MRRPALRVLLVAWAILCIVSSLAGNAEKASVVPCVDTGLIRSADHSRIVVTNDQGRRIFDLNQQTKIDSAHPLRRGDSVMVWCVATPGGIARATNVAANVTRLGGTITEVSSHSIQLVGEGGAGVVDGRLVVLLGAGTTFAQVSRNDLKIGRDVEVTGYDLGHERVQALVLDISPP